jgi:hypothetical protein
MTADSGRCTPSRAARFQATTPAAPQVGRLRRIPGQDTPGPGRRAATGALPPAQPWVTSSAMATTNATVAAVLALRWPGAERLSAEVPVTPANPPRPHTDGAPGLSRMSEDAISQLRWDVGGGT